MYCVAILNFEWLECTYNEWAWCNILIKINESSFLLLYLYYRQKSVQNKVRIQKDRKEAKKWMKKQQIKGKQREKNKTMKFALIRSWLEKHHHFDKKRLTKQNSNYRSIDHRFNTFASTQYDCRNSGKCFIRIVVKKKRDYDVTKIHFTSHISTTRVFVRLFFFMRAQYSYFVFVPCDCWACPLFTFAFYWRNHC